MTASAKTSSVSRNELTVIAAGGVGLVVAGVAMRLAAAMAVGVCGGSVSGGLFSGLVALVGHVFGFGPDTAWGGHSFDGGTDSADGGVPGGWCYWPWVVVAVVVAVVAVIVVFRVAGLVPGGEARHRFGQPTDSYQADASDMAPMLVGSIHSRHGRMVVGELIEPAASSIFNQVVNRFVNRHTGEDREPLWLATEDPDRAPYEPSAGPREGSGGPVRQGSRGSVMLVGPTQSGKTSVTTGSIATWQGSCITISVKGDIHKTMGVRGRVGEVAVFDPGASTSFPTARWSPLQNVIDHVTAARAGAALASAIPVEGVDNGAFWEDHGENLLVAYVIVAALPRLLQDDRWEPVGMAKLASWVTQRTGVKDDEINRLLDAALRDTEAVEVRQMAAVAAQTLMAMETEDPKIKASVYTTAVTAVRPYLEASVGLSATDISAMSAATWPQDYHESRPRFLDLEWLMEGHNTLYLTASADEFERLAPVLGGMLSWLVKQIHEWDIAQRHLPHPLMIVIDEAAQVRLDWLPVELSTLAGLGAFLVTVWQSLAQVEATYGHHAGTVFANHRTKIFFAGVDDEATLRALSTVVGQEHVQRDTMSHSPGSMMGSISSTANPEEFLPNHVVRQMPPGDAVLLHGTLPPAHMRAARWWNHPELSAMINSAAGDTVATCPLTDEPTGWESPVDVDAIASTATSFRQATRKQGQSGSGSPTSATVSARSAMRSAGTDRSTTLSPTGAATTSPNIRPVNARCSGCTKLLRPHEGHRRLDDPTGNTYTDLCDPCHDDDPTILSSPRRPLVVIDGQDSADSRPNGEDQS